MIRITAKTDGYCRCNTIFSAKGAEFPDGSFDPRQLQILKADPNLSVAPGRAEAQAAEEAAEGEAAGKKAAAEKEAAAKAGGGKVTPLRLNAAKSIELARAAASLEELDQLVIDQGEDRKTVIAAIDQRRAELTPEAS